MLVLKYDNNNKSKIKKMITIATNTQLNNTWAFVIVKVKPTEKFSGSKRVSGAN
jgi:hypothetical protein